jgi:hypothetical protein
MEQYLRQQGVPELGIGYQKSIKSLLLGIGVPADAAFGDYINQQRLYEDAGLQGGPTIIHNSNVIYNTPEPEIKGRLE